MRGALAVLIGLNSLSGLSVAHARENLTDLEMPAAQANVAHTRSETNDSSADRPNSRYQSSDPDCDGKLPSTSYMTTLLSKLARPSTPMRGVQCPIPPVQGQSVEQEPQP